MQDDYDNLRKAIEPIIMEADLANLGGIQGEYDRQIDLIVGYILENNKITTEFIKETFQAYFGEWAANDQEELTATVERIQGCI